MRHVHAAEPPHPELTDWEANIGQPVAFDPPEPGPDRIRGLDVLCWNMAIGRGRLGELLGRLRAGELGAPAGTDPERPLVLLIQEALRCDATVPPLPGSRHHGGGRPPAECTDIVHFARRNRLALRYAPSMRNGDSPSDRGNAVLATVALGETVALVLPHVRQRRVAVLTSLPGPGIGLVAAHIDTRGRPRDSAKSQRTRGDAGAGRPPRGFGAGRAHQARGLADALDRVAAPRTLLVGVDLNGPLGRRDPALRTLLESGFREAARAGRWSVTTRPLPFPLDHFLVRSPAPERVSVTVERLDEPGARVLSGVFGSDHHPLLARVRLSVATPATRRTASARHP